MKVLLKVLLVASFASLGGACGSITSCDIASTIREAAETGEEIACGKERVQVSGGASVGGDDATEFYNVTITESE